MGSKNILVTGGAGFIGSFVARKLVELGYTPVIFDAFIQYVNPLRSNYHSCVDIRFSGIEDKVVIVRGDTCNKHDLRRCIKKHKPSKIIHLAALPIADMANVHSEEALNSIIHGTANLLEIIRDEDFVERFVFASSSMIYGDFVSEPAGEEYPKNPKDVYGGTKLAGEIITQSYGRRFGIEYSIVRPSAVYGPTDVNNRVSQIFLEAAISGNELVLHDDGKTRLDFTYVKDTAEGFILAALKDEAKNEVFNITCGQGRPISDYADILREFFPDLRTVNKPADVFRPKRGTLDIGKARSLLGFDPKYSLEDGLREYVSFVRDMKRGKINTSTKG